MKKIGVRIKKYRVERGYSQKKFAKLVNLTPNYLSAVERGVKLPSLDTFIRIANKLDVTADDLLGDVLKLRNRIKGSQLNERLIGLPENEQKRILNVVEVMIKDAKN